MYKVLIVEDDPVIALAVERHLESWGYQVNQIGDFKAVMAHFVSFGPHLVLMDISLPFFDGYHWCAQIRAVSKVPVVFISSASDNMNIVMAVSLGGDDFIAKPFDLAVLTAKVQAILRRTYEFAGSSDLVMVGDAVLNNTDMSLTFHDTKLVLTKNEYCILAMLMARPGEVVSRDVLMRALWQTDSFIDDNTLTVNMTRLRKKLDGAGLAGFIDTRKGAGYIIG